MPKIPEWLTVPIGLVVGGVVILALEGWLGTGLRSAGAFVVCVAVGATVLHRYC